MRERMVEYENKMNEFVEKKSQELKAKVLEEARSELRKIENKRKVLEAE